MDRQIRNHAQVPVYIHQPCHEAASVPYNDSARHGQRPVKPRRAQHPSILFHVQLHVMPFHIHLRVFLDLETWRITVAGHNLESCEISFRNSKRDQCRPVPDDIIFPLFFQPPLFPFQKLGISVRVQFPLHMERAGTCLYKGKQLSRSFQILLSLRIFFRISCHLYIHIFPSFPSILSLHLSFENHGINCSTIICSIASRFWSECSTSLE